MWCWHRIKETESGNCPACRAPYGDDPHEFSAVDMQEVIAANKEKIAAEKRERERLRAMREQATREQIEFPSPRDYNGIGWGSSVLGGGIGGGMTTNLASELVGSTGGGGLVGGSSSSSSFGQFDGADLVAALGSASSSAMTSSTWPTAAQSKGPPDPPKDRSVLATMRVIRRNLVYAVGLPPNIATEDSLRKPEYFGQYGKISKIVINRNQNPGDPRRASASSYVTFAHKEDTLACILALDGFYHDGRNIRASYGTSKYCSAFIKNVRCNNPDCTYLHHMGDAEDTFTKQEIQAGYVTSGRDVQARQQQIMAQQAALAGGNSGSRKKVGCGGPSGTGKISNGPIFPPPSFDEPLKVKAKFTTLQNRPTQIGRTNGLSAASIVAGIGVAPVAAPPPPPTHTTLTALGSLKRSGIAPLAGKAAPMKPLVGVISDLTPAESLALHEKNREAGLAQQLAQAKQKHLSPSLSSLGSGPINVDSIGGSSIGAISVPSFNMGIPLMGNSFSDNFDGGRPLATKQTTSLEFGGSGILGGAPITSAVMIGGGSLAPSDNSFGLFSKESSSGGGDMWSSAIGSQSNIFGGSGPLWGDDSDLNRLAPIGSSSRNSSIIDSSGGDVGGMSLFGTNQNSYSNRGSSALASILGIELPTGSGSLRDNTSAFSGGNTFLAPIGAGGSSVGGLHGASNGHIGAIGANKPQPIGSNVFQGGGIPLSGYSNGGGNHDMALLQSLLPGVNITSGNAYCPAAPQQQPMGISELNNDQRSNNNSIGMGQQHDIQQQQRKSGGNIW